MFHINEFVRGELIAAYVSDEIPSGRIVGRSGNALLIRNDDKEIVVSRPRVEGDILDAVSGASDAPETDLSKYF